MDWERDDAPIAADHPLKKEIEVARREVRCEKLLSAIQRHYGVDRLAPAIAPYVEATLHAGRLPGPFRVVGIVEATARPIACERVFGRFGDRPFPAIAVGSASGTTFWASLRTGRVISLHHDATFYEVAARCTAEKLEDALATFESLGGAVDLDTLIRLQKEVADALGDRKSTPKPRYARVVLDVLNLTAAKARRAFETTPFEFLDLRASDLDDVPKKGAKPRAEAKKSKKPSTKPHPLLDGHRAQASTLTALDLSFRAIERLPGELASFTALETIDLRANRQLDLADAFHTLAALPKLREIDFRWGKHEGLPESIAEVASLERVNLEGWPGRRGDNYFETTQALDVLRKLPKLRELLLAGGADDGGRAGELLGDPAFSSLEVFETTGLAIAPSDARSILREGTRLPESLFRLVHLRRLALRGFAFEDPKALEGLDKCERLVDLSVIKFSGLERLEILRRLPLESLLLGPSTSLRTLDLASCDRLATLHLEKLDLLEPVAWPELPSLRSLTLLDMPWRNVGAMPKNLRSLAITHSIAASLPISSLVGVLRDQTELESLEIRLGDAPVQSIPDLARLARHGKLRELHVDSGHAIELEGPLPSLETLDLGGIFSVIPVPAWISECPGLKHVITGKSERDPEAALRRCLSAPMLESIEASIYGTPFEVPDMFASARALRRVEIAGDIGDTAAALARICEAPALEDLEIFAYSVDDLPESIERRPLRRFCYKPVRTAKPLDLARAFLRLAKTPLRELVLHETKDVSNEIGALGSLEVLRIDAYVTPKIPDAIASLPNLRRIELPRARLAGPERKRIAKLAPTCQIVDSLWG